MLDGKEGGFHLYVRIFPFPSFLPLLPGMPALILCDHVIWGFFLAHSSRKGKIKAANWNKEKSLAKGHDFFSLCLPVLLLKLLKLLRQ